MKYFTLSIIVSTALCITACGNKSQTSAAGVSQESSEVFDQAQIEASARTHIDSLAHEMNSTQHTGIILDSSSLRLTDAGKRVRPDYLLAPSVASNLTTASQEYAALAILLNDRAVAALYDMNISEYDDAIARLVSDIGDPAISKLQSSLGDILAKSGALYDEMDKEERLNYYWILMAAATVEEIYVISQNTDLFLERTTDGQVANLTSRLICIIDALDALSRYDSSAGAIIGAIAPLNELGTNSKEEFIAKIKALKAKIKASRDALLA